MKRYSIISALIFILCVLVYSANFRVIEAGDSWAPQYIPISLLKGGNLDLNEFEWLKFAVLETEIRGKTYRIYNSPVLAGILATPIYAAAQLVGLPITSRSIAYLAKFSATIYAALSVVFVFLILKELLTDKSAILLSFVYAFGTSTWTISSQSLWQHGLTQLFLTASLYCLIRAQDNPAFAGYAGGFLSLATLARYLSGIVAIFMLIYIIHRHRSQILKCILFSLPAVLFFVIYNLYYFGSPLMVGTPWAFGKFDAPIISGLSGLLFSPNRGIFVFSSFFIFSIFGAVYAWRFPSKYRLLYRYIILTVIVYILIMSKWFTWWGGYCYGYRMLVDITPFLIFLIVPFYNLIIRKKLLNLIFSVSIAVSIIVQLMGALYYDDHWNAKNRIDRYPERIWQIKNGQFHIMVQRAAQREWKMPRTSYVFERSRQPNVKYW